MIELDEAQWQGDDGKWYARFEIAESLPPDNDEPEETIRRLLDAIEALDGGARLLWTTCSLREFNIGYDSGDEPWAFNNGLSAETLKRIADVGGSLRITIYPYRP